MSNLTFILGMERFNAHVWAEVEHSLRAGGAKATIRRFHDGHVEQRDEILSQAIREADVVFITLINTRERADWLAEQLRASRAHTVFAFESMPEVMALNRVGAYRVSGGTSSLPKPMQVVLKLISRGRDEDTLYAYTKLTKIAAKLLPLMPPKLKDFRTWLSVNLYWNQPDAFNITQMVRLILRDCCNQTLDVASVRSIPMMGCFHPDSGELFEGPEAFLAWDERRRAKDERNEKRRSVRRSSFVARPASREPLVALLAFRKHVVQKQAYLGDLIHALEARGMRVLPIFVSGIEAHVAVREWLPRQPIDLLISTMGFPVVGGPAGSTKPGQYHDKAGDLLGALDVPYMAVQPLQMQTEQEWRERGVAPMQAVIMYDLPEMDGSIAPVVLGAIREQEIVASPDRLDRAADLAAAWVHLRRKPRAERRVAFVLYNYPPGLGRLGTAALLDVPASLHAALVRLNAEGYDVDLPESVDALTRQIGALDSSQDESLSPRAAVSQSLFHQIVGARQAEQIERGWGAFPGDIAPLGRDALRIDGFELGNAFVGVQPPMGVPGDPMRLLFDRDFAPHHQYVAFYRWLAEVWRADAIVHVGMHGTAEWMPGLQLGLTGECWPDALLGALPNVYLYPLNNPSEAAIARRRGYATTVSHAVPPYARAGLYKQLATLRSQLDETRSGGARKAGRQTGIDISLAPPLPIAPAPCPSLPELPPAPGETEEAYTARLSAYLDELEQRLILDGLHVFGSAPAPERAQALLEAALDVPRQGEPGLAALARSSGVPEPEVSAARAEFVRRSVLEEEPAPTVWGEITKVSIQDSASSVVKLAAHGRSLLANMRASDELGALVHALDGGYVRAAMGADPVRAGAAAFPSGRNIHGIDPWRLPSDAALERGRTMAALLLERHTRGGAPVPKTIATTLWAMDTIKTEGESLAVVLALVGARPERDGQGKIWRYELIPLVELGRPRVDGLLDISPIFRDTFQMSLDLLDDLFRRAAAAGEPEDRNAIRSHALRLQREGRSWDEATARIFTQAPGHYGTGVDELIDEGQWEADDALAEMYARRGAHTYGGGRAGAAATETLRAMLGTVDHVFQAIDSVEYGLTDMSHYYGHTGALQLAASKARDASIPLTYAEGYTGAIKIAGAQELIQLEARAKLLNPKWYEGMLQHGFAGAAEIGNRFTYLLGWGAIGTGVPSWVFDDAAATFVLDDAMRERLEQANPQAARNAVARLLEASGRGLWQAEDETLDRLQALYADLEDRLEGIRA